jgi:competence protein ComEC
MWYAAAEERAQHLSPKFSGNTLKITLYLTEFTETRDNSIRLTGQPQGDPALPGKIRLTWYAPAALPRLGERWSLEVRLRAPRGFDNPGGFDYEKWLHRNRLGATGYVVDSPGNRRLALPPASSRAAIRRAIVDRIDSLFDAGDARAVLKAIVVGARADISTRQWQVFSSTGTSHLMAISGLHIGLAAAGAFLMARILTAFCMPRGNLRDAAVWTALLVAYGYAELSGFAVPAQRAILMLSFASGALLLRRRVDGVRMLALVACATVAADPLIIYAPGFQLSFLAVTILLWSARALPGTTPSWPDPRAGRVLAGARRLAIIQFALLFGLLPVTVATFGRVPLLAPWHEHLHFSIWVLLISDCANFFDVNSLL